jgi:membrane protease subunit HflK
MPWKNQTGGGGQGPWGGGGGQGPWGGGNRPPDLEEILRKGQDRVKRMLPGGFGSGRSLAFIALIGIALWLATGFYRVQPDEQGIALVLGRIWKQTPPGLNYNLPAPVGEVFTPKVTRVNRVEIGFRSTGDTGSDSTPQDVPEESLMLTGDSNIISTHFVVLWQISDAKKYLFAIRNPDEVVKNVAESVMREIIGQTEFEYARTQGRGKIEGDARERMQKLLDTYQSGILVTQVAAQNIAPPEATIDAFRDVQAASADNDRAVNEAQAYYNKVTQQAQGQAQQIINQAQAYKEQTVALATGNAQRFELVLQQYEKAKEITRRRIYLETMEQLLKGMSKVLVGGKPGAGAIPFLSLNDLIKQRQAQMQPQLPAGAGSNTGANP